MRSSDEIHRINRSSRKRLPKLARTKLRSEMACEAAVASRRFPLVRCHSRSAVAPDRSRSCGRSEATFFIWSWCLWRVEEGCFGGELYAQPKKKPIETFLHPSCDRAPQEYDQRRIVSPEIDRFWFASASRPGIVEAARHVVSSRTSKYH